MKINVQFSQIKKPHHYNAALAQTLVFVVSEVSAKNLNVFGNLF
jgi:hypothetical protein